MDKETENLKIEYLSVSDLKPYKKNARRHADEDVLTIMESIKEFGFSDPIGIWGDDNTIVEGHGRLIAAKRLGLKEVPCIRLDHLTDEQRRAYALAHNKTAEMSEWDFDLLPQELDDILNIDMSAFGFDLDFKAETEPEEEQNEDLEEDEIPDLPEEAQTEAGDLYILGEHRLLCGDSTNPEDVAKVCNGSLVDLVFTDPPYGMKKEADGVLNDNLNFDNLLEFNKKWIPLTFDHMKENGSWYCWGIDEPLMDIYGAILRPMQDANKITFRNFITWDKTNGMGQLSPDFRKYPTASEKCLFAMCGVEGFNNNVDHFNPAYEPILTYLRSEGDRVGLNQKKCREICGNFMYGHWFSKAEFTIIPEKHYKKLQDYYKGEAFTLPYKELGSLFKEKEGKDFKEALAEKRAYFNNTHDNMNDVWHFSRTSQKERETTGGHATPKPLALCARAILSSSREGETVLDVFGGSGSTLIACEELHRKCCMIELDPKYVDVIVKRWENHTGKKAQRITAEEQAND